MVDFLKWWYIDFLTGDNLSWTSLINLFPKTMVLLVGLGISIGVIRFIVNPFIRGFKRGMKNDNKKEM